jgi:hypothetical protein
MQRSSAHMQPHTCSYAHARPVLRLVDHATTTGLHSQMHPKVAELGLRRFLAVSWLNKLPLSNSGMSAFHLAWNVGLSNYHAVQRALALPQAIMLLTSLVGLSVPLHLLTAGFVFDDTVHWAHAPRLVGLAWFICGGVCLFMTFFCAIYCTEYLRTLRDASTQIVTDQPLHRLFISDIVHAQPLTCTVAYVLPSTRTTATVAVLLCFASGVPWLYIDFWGFTPISVVLSALSVNRRTPMRTPSVDGVVASDDLAADGGALMRLAIVAVSSVLLLVGYLVRQLVSEGGPSTSDARWAIRLDSSQINSRYSQRLDE